jgi:hypothetical protein
MEESELKTISFKVSGADAEVIDRAVRESGLSRSDYIRQRLLSDPQHTDNSAGKANPQDPVVLLQELLFGTKRMHEAIYQLAEQSGAFTDEQLDAVQAESLQAGIDYLKDLDAHICRNRQRVGFEQGTK